MGYNIGDRPENNLPGIDLDSFYQLAGGSGSAVVKGRVLVLAFADFSDDDYTAFFVRLQALNTTNNIRIVGVLYDDSSATAAVSGPNFAVAVANLSGAGVTFDIVNNGQWNTGPAASYLNNGGGIGHPFAYVVSKFYEITHKLDDTSSGPSIEDAINALYIGPTIVATDPPTTNSVSDISSVGITYSEEVSNADVNTNYALSGAGKGTLSNNPSSADADAVVDNKYNLTINGGAPTDGALTITISNVTDSIFYDPVPLEDTTIDYTLDVTAPTIQSSTLAPDNTSIQITFNEGVYANNDQTGNLDDSDFNINYQANGSGITLDNIIASHTAGSDTVTFALSFSGPLSGAETIEISPLADSVYDAAALAASTGTTTGAVALNDDLPPVVVEVKINPHLDDRMYGNKGVKK